MTGDWTEDRLRRAAFAYLARYATNRAGLISLLSRKASRDEAGAALGPALMDRIEAVANQCEQLGLIDETAYAAGRAAALSRKGMGVRLIRRDLTSRGVPQAVLEATIEGLQAEAAEDADWDAAIRLARRRRLGPFAQSAAGQDPGQADRQYRRALATFARAGIGYDIARRILSARTEEDLVGPAL